MAKPPQSFALSCWLDRGNLIILVEHPCCPLTAGHCSHRSHPHQSMCGCVSCGPEQKVRWDKKSGETKSLVRWKVWWDQKSGETKSLMRPKVQWDQKSGHEDIHMCDNWDIPTMTSGTPRFYRVSDDLINLFRRVLLHHVMSRTQNFRRRILSSAVAPAFKTIGYMTMLLTCPKMSGAESKSNLPRKLFRWYDQFSCHTINFPCEQSTRKSDWSWFCWPEWFNNEISIMG